MKETGTTHWNSPNTCATNESGFSALPSGYRDGINDIYGGMGSTPTSGRSTEGDSYNAWYRYLNYYGSGVYRGSSSKECGFSVRCLRD